MNYDFEFGLEIVRKANENKIDEDIYKRWLCGYEKELSFSEFKRRVMVASRAALTPKKETEKEILAKVKKISEMRCE